MNERKKPEEVESSAKAPAATTGKLTSEAAPTDSELALNKLDGVAGGKGKPVMMGPDLWE
jgi:hypothetical protein